MKSVENLSGIRPMQFKIVVQVEESAKETKGGILLPELSQDMRQFEITRGTIVAAGPAAFTDEDQYPPGTEKPQVGDRIWFDKYAGTQVKAARDHKILYRVIEDTDVTGIFVLDEAQAKDLVA